MDGGRMLKGGERTEVKGGWGDGGLLAEGNNNNNNKKKGWRDEDGGRLCVFFWSLRKN